MPTFPSTRSPGRDQNAVLFTDAKLTLKAVITDTTGKSIPNSTLIVGLDGDWPFFVCTAPVVYYKNSAGQVVSMLPNIAGAATVTLTGSRGTQTAAVLAQLITALAASGLPIVDSTTA